MFNFHLSPDKALTTFILKLTENYSINVIYLDSLLMVVGLLLCSLLSKLTLFYAA